MDGYKSDVYDTVKLAELRYKVLYPNSYIKLQIINKNSENNFHLIGESSLFAFIGMADMTDIIRFSFIKLLYVIFF